jgi:hypothetical protein
VGEIKLVNELLIRRGFLQRMQVDTVEILNDRLLERESVIHVDLYEHRHELEFRDDGRTPAALTGDQLVLSLFTFDGSNNDGLKNAELANGRGERL